MLELQHELPLKQLIEFVKVLLRYAYRGNSPTVKDGPSVGDTEAVCNIRTPPRDSAEHPHCLTKLHQGELFRPVSKETVYAPSPLRIAIWSVS